MYIVILYMVTAADLFTVCPRQSRLLELSDQESWNPLLLPPLPPLLPGRGGREGEGWKGRGEAKREDEGRRG